VKFVLIAIVLILLWPLLRKLQKRPVDDPPPAKLEPRTKTRAALPAHHDESEASAKAAADARFQDLMRTVVLLEDNEWAACAIDGVTEEWARFTAADVRGFAAIPAGRHRVVTTVLGREAALDFVLLPGDVFVRRLDRAAAKWVPLEGDELARAKKRGEGGEKGDLGDALVSYRSTLGIARAQRGTIASPDAVVLRVTTALSALIESAESAGREGAPLDALEAEASKLGMDLVGVPLTRDQIEALAKLGARVPRLGQAVMPGA
jgi:hypothetical protein